MKKILIAALAFSLLGGTAASAQDWRRDNGHNGRGQDSRNSDRNDRSRDDRGRDDRGRDDRRGYNDRRDDRSYGDRGYGDRGYDSRNSGNRGGQRWARGQRLPPAYMGYGVDYNRYHLRRPPRGYQWVRVDDDYVLTAIATGLIMEVISGAGY